MQRCDPKLPNYDAGRVTTVRRGEKARSNPPPVSPPVRVGRPPYLERSDGEIVVFRLYEFGGGLKHAGGDGKIGSLLDQDE